MKMSTVFLGVAGAALAVAAEADQVIADDLIVQGSLCAGGVDCILNENFGFDTVRLKGNDPAIRFFDTSAGTFPTNDWLIGIADGTVDGPARFFINDIDGGSSVLVLEAGATGGIALGAFSTLETNAVSVGAEGVERRIVNVADGVDPTDAATVGQLSTQTDAKAAELDAAIVTLQQSIGDLESRLDAILSQIEANQ